MKTVIMKLSKNKMFLLMFLMTFMLHDGIYASLNQTGNKSDKEWKNYLINNVMPVMRPYREQFETMLTADEKLQIEQIRANITESLKARKEAGLGEGRLSLRKIKMTDEQITVWKQTREEIYQALLDAAVIAHHHEKELELISVKEEKNRLKWSVDLWQIFANEHPWLSRRRASILRQNVSRLLPIDHIDKVVFIVWNPNNTLPF